MAGKIGLGTAGGAGMPVTLSVFGPLGAEFMGSIPDFTADITVGIADIIVSMGCQLRQNFCGDGTAVLQP